MKKQYWLFYETLDFHAEIFVSEGEFNEEFNHQYRGPFKTLKDCRDHGLDLINDDITSFKEMKYSIQHGKPSKLK